MLVLVRDIRKGDAVLGCLFQSAIAVLGRIEIPGLEAVKEWMVKALTEAEDRYPAQIK